MVSVAWLAWGFADRGPPGAFAAATKMMLTILS
jgi:hypothetical protein